jgi:hypothetical protein
VSALHEGQHHGSVTVDGHLDVPADVDDYLEVE